MPLVTVRDLDRFNDPAKELEPVPDEKYWPLVLNVPPVMPLVAVRDLDIFREPAKVEEPVPESVMFPFNTMLPPIEALLVNSKGAEKVAPPVNVQRPEMVWAADLEAGPLEP